MSGRRQFGNIRRLPSGQWQARTVRLEGVRTGRSTKQTPIFAGRPALDVSS